jgi:hypothetical protein
MICIKDKALRASGCTADEADLGEVIARAVQRPRIGFLPTRSVERRCQTNWAQVE